MGLVEVGVGLIPAGAAARNGAADRLAGGAAPAPTRCPPSAACWRRSARRRSAPARPRRAISASSASRPDRLRAGPADRRGEEVRARPRRRGLSPADARRDCYATGIGGKATLMIGVYQFKVGGFISDYDATIGRDARHRPLRRRPLAAAVGGRGLLLASNWSAIHAPPAKREDAGADDALCWRRGSRCGIEGTKSEDPSSIAKERGRDERAAYYDRPRIRSGSPPFSGSAGGNIWSKSSDRRRGADGGGQSAARDACARRGRMTWRRRRWGRS